MTNRWQAAWHRLRSGLPGPIRRWVSATIQSVLTGATRWYRGSRRYRLMHERSVEALSGRAMQGAGRDDQFFKAYVRAQLDDALHFIHGQVLGPRVMDRTIYLAGLLDTVLPVSREKLSLLCVGCRNSQELDYLQTRCRLRDLQGLDLQSTDSRITVGDMHQIPFPDHAFDILYACHSLEHAYDLDRTLAECLRVTKSGGIMVIEMPVNYRVSETDRWDVGSAGKLVARLGSVVEEVLVSEDSGQNARVIVRICKPAALAGTASSMEPLSSPHTP